MIDIAERFPLPEPIGGDGGGVDVEGPYDNSILEDLLWTLDVEFAKTRREDGFKIMCPGNEGWPDGEQHSEIVATLNDGTIVFVRNGWPCFSCRHAHCSEGMKQGKKTWEDFIDYHDPDRKYFDYPEQTDINELLSYFDAVPDNLPMEMRYAYVYENKQGRIYSNDGNNWVDEQNRPVL
jgi:hypothetical protein